MSWQDNRRRKRTWYRHYRSVCDNMNAITCQGNPVAAEALVASDILIAIISV